MAVELVAVERRVWSGKASFVFARTTVGEIGILPGHEQTLAQLEEAGVVRIDGVDGSPTTVAVHGGFLHVTPESVTILAESAEIGEEIDVARAGRRVTGLMRPSPRERPLRPAPRYGSKPRAPSRRRMGAVASIAGILLLLGCLCLGYLAIRRVRLMRGGGVDVCLRRPGPGRRPVRVSRDAAAGWHFGVGRYQGNEFAWYRLTSLRPGATAVLDRTDSRSSSAATPRPRRPTPCPRRRRCSAAGWGSGSSSWP